MDNKNNKIEKYEKDINKNLFSLEKDDIEREKELKEIEERISKLKTNFTGTTGNNILEFLFNTEYDKSNSNLSQQRIKNASTDNYDKVKKVLGHQEWDSLFSLEEKRIKRYKDYNTIYSYITDVALCIDSFADMIISPDDLISNNDNFSVEGLKTINENVYREVMNNLRELNKKYKLNKKQKEIIKQTLILGDQFVAVLKYDEEFRKQILTEQHNRISVLKEDLLTESFTEECLNDENTKIEFETIFKEEADSSKDPNNFYKNIVDNIKEVINKDIKVKSPSSLFDSKDIKKKDSFKMDNIKGSIIKYLEPEKTVKLVIDGMEFGYIYAQLESVKEYPSNKFLTDIFDSRIDNDINYVKSKENLITDIFTKGISKKLNKEFISKNKEFKDFIYLLLKNKNYRKQKVNFIYFSPEEVHHFRIDEKDGYGTSKIARSLFAAKLYLASLISQQMDKLSGKEKKVVYTEIGVDDDVEGAVNEVVRNIKSKEVQSDSLGNLDTIMNTMGNNQFYVIPTIDGEKPVEFDSISAVESNADEEWLNFLLRSIIKGMGYPANYIDSTNETDYAKTVVMQNALFVRSLISDQDEFSDQFTDFYKHLYKNEYEIIIKEKDNKKKNSKNNNDDKEILQEKINAITVKFPRPTILNLANVNDHIGTVSSTIDFIVGLYIDDNQTEGDEPKKKLLYKKKLAKEMLPSLPFDKYDEIFDSVVSDIKEENLKKNTLPNNDSSGGEDLGGDDNFNY